MLGLSLYSFAAILATIDIFLNFFRVLWEYEYAVMCIIIVVYLGLAGFHSYQMYKTIEKKKSEGRDIKFWGLPNMKTLILGAFFFILPAIIKLFDMHLEAHEYQFALRLSIYSLYLIYIAQMTTELEM